ncbi:MAG: hypothetical protein A3F84_22405 [Candidatus Handelsmanbacteria bacterium RIFCSPLOWO2_12_FULL_64_10]|uniref:Uncharacterized protein n=1 Tax=Handelsmanbacteria sp. (strain RIFCSPLOWO2_12_FULL_64_10) TaxID=1817868 RepID=A0A1F6CSF4_HANXR|nr:MAG: hypothetical protein A3F84_22405 [Candidatus Handelsmanbacteria bacterium RIFCSPLOWO2_12_FULL_64_10]
MGPPTESPQHRDRLIWRGGFSQGLVPQRHYCVGAKGELSGEMTSGHCGLFRGESGSQSMRRLSWERLLTDVTWKYDVGNTDLFEDLSAPR